MAQRPTREEFQIFSREYDHPLKTDADYLEFKLRNFTGKLLQSGEIKRPKTSQGKWDARLKLKFPDDGIYELELTLHDAVENVSSYIHKLFVDTSELQHGMVFGADSAHPWGKNSHYGQQVVKSRLIIGSASLGGKFEWSRFEIPTPMLTYSNYARNTGEIFGHAASKQTKLQFQVYKEYPDYFSAEKFCTGAVVTGIVIYRDKKSVDCLQKELGINDLSAYYQALQNKCNSLLPFLTAACINNQHQKRTERYFGISKTRLEHVRVGFYSGGSEIASNWQEQRTEFVQKLNVAQGSVVSARVAIYGTIKVAGIDYNYNGLSSSFSNFMSLSQRPLSQSLCKNTACRNLEVEYFNQAVNAKGNWETWPGWPSIAGGQSCGAASAVMALAQLGRVGGVGSNLKSFVFKDNNLQLRGKQCQRGGAFAVTAYNSACNMSSLAGLNRLLSQFKVSTRVHIVKAAEAAKVLQEVIKPAIDRGKPIILSYKSPISHILLISGYTYGGELIVQDPYRDIQNNYQKGKYDYSGKNAIYSLYPNNKFTINYLLEIL